MATKEQIDKLSADIDALIAAAKPQTPAAPPAPAADPALDEIDAKVVAATAALQTPPTT